MKPTLTIIQSTHASLGGLQQSGLLERHKCLLTEYGKAFHVILYTCDTVDYSAQLGVEHHPVRWLPQYFGWRHLAFYLWLVWQAPCMKGVIKVFGSNIPTLPLVKLISRRPMMVTYQFDYAEQTRKSERSRLKYWLAPLLEKLALNPADLVLVTTGRLEKKAQEVYHKKTVLLPNWVDLDAVEQPDFGTSRRNDMILYAGRLHPSKGVDILIRAFAWVRQRHPGVKLVICGVGEEQERLKYLAESLSVSGVEFCGRLPNSEVLKMMSTAAIFVLPTTTMEGHPKALIEAMACGMACVASDVPGNSDAITNGETGLLVPSEDVPALANALHRLLTDSNVRHKLSRNAQSTVRNFSFSTVVATDIQLILDVSESTLRQKGTKAI